MAIKRMISNDGGYRELQTKLARVGKIRCGAYVQEPGRRGRPSKLNTWRFTSQDEHLIRVLAQGYGGEAVEYKPQGGGPSEWEVVTDTDAVPVYIINGQNIDPNYEAWGRGRTCMRRCDGVTNRIDETPCVCNSSQPPKDLCKITLRVNLLLRDVPGFGSWLFETHGENAVAEISSLSTLVRAAPMPVPAMFRLRTESRRPWDPEKRAFVTREFQVPWFDVSALSAAQIGAGGDVLTRALVAAGAPMLDAGSRPALEAAPADRPSAVAETAFVPQSLTADSTTAPAETSPSARPSAPTTVADEPPPEDASSAPTANQTSTSAGTTPSAPVTLSDADRATILAKIEQKTSVAELKKLAATLVARGVKDEKIKQALKSKAASIEAALQIGGSAPGPADAPRAVPDPAPDHQRALKSSSAEVAGPIGNEAQQHVDAVIEPTGNYTAHPDDTITEDPADTWPSEEPPEDPDVRYPVGSQVEVGGITFTKHTAVADAFAVPPMNPPDSPHGDGPTYDQNAEFMNLFALGGQRGWTTADVHDRIKAFCKVSRSQEATGEQLHALTEAIMSGQVT